MQIEHDKIPAYVEKQVALRRDYVSILKEIAATRSDVILLWVREEPRTFLQKINAALKSD